MPPNILTFLNHMTTQSYQDEIVDPVIRKICDKMDSEQFTFTEERNISIKFGDITVVVEGKIDTVDVHIDGIFYFEFNEVSNIALSKSFDNAIMLHTKKVLEADRIKLNTAVKRILEDNEKPYVQRF